MTQSNLNKSVLITGIAGSGGSYLAEYIVGHIKDVQVHGIARWHSTTAHNNLEAINTNVTIHECDLSDLSSVYRVLNDVRPDVIFHLASHANVRVCFDMPLAILQNNIMGTANLLESIRLIDFDPTILICSTSEVYGQVHADDIPINEKCTFRPASPYAVSKVTQDLLGQSYFASFKSRVITTRMFTYINPRRGDLFATSFARQIARIELGLQKEISHGNLNSVRTLLDVRDAARAYWEASLKCIPGEAYNIGGKVTVTVGEVLNMLIQRSTVDIPTRLAKELLRPADVTLQMPDTSKFVKQTGWAPRFDIEDSLNELMQFSRAFVKQNETVHL